MTMAANRQPPAGVEVRAYDFTRATEVGEHWAELDELRESHPFFWSTHAEGFWVIASPGAVRDAYRDPELFSSTRVNVLVPDSPRYIPLGCDPPEHTGYRHVLNPWFAPGPVARLETELRAFSREIVASLVQQGSCELNQDFAAKLPAFAFLHSMGLPLEDAPMFCHWVEEEFIGLRGDDPRAALATYLSRIQSYFAPLIEDRRQSPTEPEDFLTYYVRQSPNGQPITDEEIFSTLYTLVLGGLDTTRSFLTYIFHYLATHPAHRERIVCEPDIIPQAVEEFLRLFPIATGPGRCVTRDVVFEGCPMNKGDMVKPILSAENRDPTRWHNPTWADFEREDIRHNTFGLGPHRCLGSHLTRLEVRIALEEWHALIPEYRLAPDAKVTEGATELGLTNLPLAWDVEEAP